MSQLAEAFQKLFPVASRKIDMNVVRHKDIVPEIRSLDEKKRTMEIISSTETPDRYKDVLKSAGFQTDNYMKGGGVILWSHDAHSQPPIAKTLSIGVQASPAALVQTIEFADAATSAFADQIFRLYQQKFLRSFSVGFRPLAPPEMIMDEKGEPTGGFLFASTELIEVSAVACPAQPEAVARAIESGIITAADAGKVFIAEAPDLQDFDARLSVLEMQMDALRRDVGRMRSGDIETLGDLEHLLLKGE